MKEKKMVRVEYKHIEYEGWEVPDRVIEMKAWCKEKFGKNPCGKGSTKIWAYSSLYGYNDGFNDDEVCYGYYYPAFYFTDEKHMAWFRLRWG